MNKGIFFIPIYNKNFPLDQIMEEIHENCIKAERNNINEVFFGEHITDKFEKISSSLMMVSMFSKITKKIKLATLTTNLNFYHPSILAALISQADNASKGRLILGIGSGANLSDIEVIENLGKNNHALMLESYGIIKKLLYQNNTILKFKTKNFKVTNQKTFNEKLGLGYFNKLYKSRKNLEIIMPVLGENSYNLKICAQNNWSIVISNFCSQSLVEHHISKYLEYSSLSRTKALKKIKLSRTIFLTESGKESKKYLLKNNSPFLFLNKVIFNKLKTFSKNSCFGGSKNYIEATKDTVLHGSMKDVNNYLDKLNNKFKGELSSLIYTSVPKTKYKIYNNSLDIFCKSLKV